MNIIAMVDWIITSLTIWILQHAPVLITNILTCMNLFVRMQIIMGITMITEIIMEVTHIIHSRTSLTTRTPPLIPSRTSLTTPSPTRTTLPHPPLIPSRTSLTTPSRTSLTTPSPTTLSHPPLIPSRTSLTPTIVLLKKVRETQSMLNTKRIVM